MNTLYTLGYLAWTPDTFRAQVEALQAIVADVRFKPASRYLAWRQATLQRTLATRYHSVQVLGNSNYKGGPVNIVDLEAGLTVLLNLLEEASVVLLCACRDLQRCHRRLVAAAFMARSGQPVVHLEPPETNLPVFR